MNHEILYWYVKLRSPLRTNNRCTNKEKANLLLRLREEGHGAGTPTEALLIGRGREVLCRHALPRRRLPQRARRRRPSLRRRLQRPARSSIEGFSGTDISILGVVVSHGPRSAAAAAAESAMPQAPATAFSARSNANQMKANKKCGSLAEAAALTAPAGPKAPMSPLVISQTSALSLTQ